MEPKTITTTIRTMKGLGRAELVFDPVEYDPSKITFRQDALDIIDFLSAVVCNGTKSNIERILKDHFRDGGTLDSWYIEHNVMKKFNPES